MIGLIRHTRGELNNSVEHHCPRFINHSLLQYRLRTRLRIWRLRFGLRTRIPLGINIHPIRNNNNNNPSKSKNPIPGLSTRKRNFSHLLTFNNNKKICSKEKTCCDHYVMMCPTFFDNIKKIISIFRLLFFVLNFSMTGVAMSTIFLFV